MSLVIFFMVGGLGLLLGLWCFGAPLDQLAVLAALLFVSSAFQVWARGNARWADRANADEITNRMPMAVYFAISTVLLLANVAYVSRITLLL